MGSYLLKSHEMALDLVGNHAFFTKGRHRAQKDQGALPRWCSWALTLSPFTREQTL